MFKDNTFSARHNDYGSRVKGSNQILVCRFFLYNRSLKQKSGGEMKVITGLLGWLSSVQAETGVPSSNPRNTRGGERRLDT